jgi:hypothetical protein
VTVYTYDFYIENRRKSRRAHRKVHRERKIGYYSKATKKRQDYRRTWR